LAEIANTQTMAEFLFELALTIVEIFFEALVESAAAALVDLASRGLLKVFPKSNARPEFALVAYALLGAVAGGLSVLIVPQPVFRPSKLHGMSVLVSPLLTGMVMAFVGSMVRKRGKQITRIESFAYGFAFAFGMALIRYLLVSPIS
jgi:hypothetical protein